MKKSVGGNHRSLLSNSDGYAASVGSSHGLSRPESASACETLAFAPAAKNEPRALYTRQRPLTATHRRPCGMEDADTGLAAPRDPAIAARPPSVLRPQSAITRKVNVAMNMASMGATTARRATVDDSASSSTHVSWLLGDVATQRSAGASAPTPPAPAPRTVLKKAAFVRASVALTSSLRRVSATRRPTLTPAQQKRLQFVAECRDSVRKKCSELVGRTQVAAVAVIQRWYTKCRNRKRFHCQLRKLRNEHREQLRLQLLHYKFIWAARSVISLIYSPMRIRRIVTVQSLYRGHRLRSHGLVTRMKEAFLSALLRIRVADQRRDAAGVVQRAWRRFAFLKAVYEYVTVSTNHKARMIQRNYRNFEYRCERRTLKQLIDARTREAVCCLQRAWRRHLSREQRKLQAFCTRHLLKV